MVGNGTIASVAALVSDQWLVRAACCGKTRMQPAMNAMSVAEAAYRLRARPPEACGLSKKSPTTGPKGRVKMNAAQKRTVRETFVKR
jgi:hypothetical protein